MDNFGNSAPPPADLPQPSQPAKSDPPQQIQQSEQPQEQLQTQELLQPQGPPALQQPSNSYWHAQITDETPENRFKPDLADFIFALVAFALGYMYSRWVFTAMQGWGVTVFTTAYLLTATAYLIRKKAFKMSKEAVFWFAVTLIIGVSYALWNNVGFAGVRFFALFCAAGYYIVISTGTTMTGKTSNFFIVDCISTFIVLPFRNFFNQYVSFSAPVKAEKRGKILPSLLGLAVAAILAFILVPLLEAADAGGFAVIMAFVRSQFEFRFSYQIIFTIVTIPVAAYLYGLVSGAVHKKGTDAFSLEGAKDAVAVLRFLHPSTINIILGAVCVIYLVFIFSQLPYFFSAFGGARPDGWLTYAEFARHGFFELVTIAGINLAVLTASNLCSKKLRVQSRMLKIFNVVLAVITLVLIATAFSKMALYIGVFGLTMRRLLPCVFMVFLAIVFIGLIALQKWDFSIVRLSLIVGAVLIVGLSLSNPDAMVVRYNANRYISGTLSRFDVDIAHRAGLAGVLPAIEVLEHTEDWGLQSRIIRYLQFQYRGGSPNEQSLESLRARQALREGNFHPQRPQPSP